MFVVYVIKTTVLTVLRCSIVQSVQAGYVKNVEINAIAADHSFVLMDIVHSPLTAAIRRTVMRAHVQNTLNASVSVALSSTVRIAMMGKLTQSVNVWNVMTIFVLIAEFTYVKKMAWMDAIVVLES